MLTWRAVSRPANTLRRGLQTQRRTIYGSTHLPRPNGFLAKVRFRADGTPRSKWVGAAFGTLILLQALTLAAANKLMLETGVSISLFLCVLEMQRADMEYDRVKFDDYQETRNYYKRLYQCASSLPREELEEFLEAMNYGIKTYGGSNGVEKAHEIMRSTAAHIHRTFQELDYSDNDAVVTAMNYVILVLGSSLPELVELIPDSLDVDDDSPFALQYINIKDRSRKDSKAGLNDYESLG